MPLRTNSFRAFVFFLAGFGLTGCESAVFGGGNVAPIAVWEVASVVTTDKTIGDHIVSYYSGKNCSTARQELGLHYCEEDEPKNPPDGYCYRTLGKVTCYEQPDPRREAQALGRD
ncbi:MAG: hypothetical protein OQJ99_01570 [Rhodospirillales bacterium]|nr:hypothetical protein [Rhodospirillales bacterium]MCW8952319.1 hypothetical protein [Rhodospirillales bacterium]